MTSSLSVCSRESLVSTLFGSGTVTYLRNKHRGGVSGGKGVRYEDLFAVAQIAEHARRLGADCSFVSVQAQVPVYFIDDLVVREQGNSPAEFCFQLKNSPDVTWGSGEKSIADDCKKQLQLATFAELPAPRVVLVTSDAQCAKSLESSVPDELSGAVAVRWFPWVENTNVLCKLWPEEIEAVAWLSKHETPNFQEVSDVLKILLGVWVSQNGNVVVADLIEEARKLSPTLIRPLVPYETALQALTEEFKNALAEIDNFSYSIVKGFFCWEFWFPNGSVERGVFAQDCLSASFERFQDRIVRQRPVTFEEIEEDLL